MQAVTEPSGWDGLAPGSFPAPEIDASGFVAGSLIAGRYRLDEIIGRGGMATVWRGHDLRLGRDVAIKLCAPSSGTGQRAIREERFSSTLLHPNIVSIFDAGDIPSGETSAASAYIVMEYVNGVTAQQIAPIPWREAARIVRQAADGLAAAHERGIVHCDVKPGNLLIDSRGRVLVADFGIAMPVETEPGDFVHGSPAYLAPERLTGERADPRVDVYGLGGILAYLITGARPGDDALSLPLDCPTAIATLIARARARDQRGRYPDAGAFRDALDSATSATAMTPTETTIRLPRGAQPDRRNAPDASRRVISHPMRVQPRSADVRHTAQQTAAMSPSPLRPPTSARAVTPARPTNHRLRTYIIVGVLGLLAIIASVMALREIVTTAGISAAAPPVAAAVEMPAVEGETFATAIGRLSEDGITVDRVDVVYGPGPINQVVAQNPAPGASVGDDQLVTLVVRTGR